MDKYAVDIDKVLDAFEESEAREESQIWTSAKSPISEVNKSLNYCDIGTHLYEDSLLTCNSNKSTINNSTISNIYQQPNEDPNYKLSLSKIEFPPLVKSPSIPEQESLISWNYDLSKPSIPLSHETLKSELSLNNTKHNPVFEHNVPKDFIEMPKNEKTFSTHNFAKDILSVRNDCRNSLEAADLKNDYIIEVSQAKNIGELGSPFNQASGSENLLGHVESSDNLVLKNASLTKEINHCKHMAQSGTSMNDSTSEIESSSKIGSTTEQKSFDVSNCSILGKVSGTQNIEVQNSDDQIINPKTTNLQASNVDISATSNINITESSETQDLNAIGFSEISEFNLSLDEMNEYLNDLDILQPTLDEDSGVSSQEDLNGNTVMSAHVFDKECQQLEAKWKESSESEIGSNTSTGLHCHVESQVLELEMACEMKVQGPAAAYIDSVSEQSSETLVESFNTECCTQGKACEATENIDNIKTSENLHPPLEGMKDSDDSALHPQASEHSIENSPLREKHLLENVETCQNTDVVVNHVSESLNTESLNLEEDMDLGENHTEDNLLESGKNLPRLQRPTTLNLPSRAISSSCYESEEQPTAICDAFVDESHVETPFEFDSPPYDANKDLLSPDSENENHLPQIGVDKPFWIPDSSAANCMHCNLKFTVIKRRHHCRACGKVLCSRCCNQKARLSFLQNKEDRVCQQCFEILTAASQSGHIGLCNESPASSSCGSSPSFSSAQVNSNFAQNGHWRPNPNNPDDYCSTVSPLQQVDSLAKRPPPTVMVPVGVLKRGSKPRGEPKQVIFSDGIRPGGDLTDLTEPVEMLLPYRRQGRRRVDKVGGENSSLQNQANSASTTGKKKIALSRHRFKRAMVSDSEGPLPPILLPHDHASDEKLDLDGLLLRLRDEQESPVVFAVTKNMHVLTKIAKLDCCYGKECWCFISHGLCTVGQDEVLLIIECFPDEDIIPRDVFRVFSKIYDNASKGSTVGELGHIIFPDGIFGSWEHRGFLFIRPTLQCLSKLVLPSTPFLVALLIQKEEVPWAKVFPLRLMLRLGAECRYYPCSLVSVRFRKPVYSEIGQTIMSVLADLRNYQFTIPFVPGLVVLIYMEDKKTCVNIPRNRYEKLMKVLNSNNVEHVLALGSNFSTDADSHLVCTQKDGDYQTQAINIENTTRKVTGASFIVFSGALKSSTGLTAKFSIVEDGLLVQIPQDTMTALHSALRDMRDLTINCGQVNAPEPDEVVLIQWTSDDKKFNMGVISPVDGTNLEGVSSLRIHTSTDYAGENYLIRWTEVFFLDVDRNRNSRRTDAIDPCRLAETVAQAFCMALIPYLDPLADADMTRIGLRVILDAERDKVEYEVGAQGQPLPTMYMNALDSSLIPVMSRITSATQDEPLALELTFHILMK